MANLFVLAQALDPVTESISSELGNERNTLGRSGAGAIEMLACEMTAELQVQGSPNGDRTLTTKGVAFEASVQGGAALAIRGLDPDLVIKPFHQAGMVRSIPEFRVNAFNHHHGMQAESPCALSFSSRKILWSSTREIRESVASFLHCL